MAHRTHTIEESQQDKAVMTHDIIEGTVTAVDYDAETIAVTLDQPYKPRSLSTTNWGKFQEEGYDGLPSSPVVTALTDVPIVYNCQEVDEAVAGAFLVGEKVLILAIGTDYQAVGFPDEVKDCGPRWFYFETDGYGGGHGLTAYVTVWDVLLNQVATEIPTNDGGFASFPAPKDTISKWLNKSEVQGEDLFTAGQEGNEKGDAVGWTISARCPAGFITGETPPGPGTPPRPPAETCPVKLKPLDPCSCTGPPTPPLCASCNCVCNSGHTLNPSSNAFDLNGNGLIDSWTFSSFNDSKLYCCNPPFFLRRCGTAMYGIDFQNVLEALAPNAGNPSLGDSYASSWRLTPLNAWGVAWGKHMSSRTKLVWNLDSDQKDYLWNSSCTGKGCPCTSLFGVGGGCTPPHETVFNHDTTLSIIGPLGTWGNLFQTQTGFQDRLAKTGLSTIDGVAGGFVIGDNPEGAHKVFAFYTPTVMAQLYVYRYRTASEVRTTSAGGTCIIISPPTVTYGPRVTLAMGAIDSGIDADNKDPRTQSNNTTFANAIVACIETFHSANGFGPEGDPFPPITVDGSLRSGPSGTALTTTTI